MSRPASVAVAAAVVFAVCVATVLVAGSSGGSRGTSRVESRISARIPLPGRPFAVATGEGRVWVLTRRPNAALWRIDPTSSRVVGKPTRLPVDPWGLAVGAGSVWVTPNGADGRLIRIDARTGRISARISARPIYFGSVVAVGGGFVWTGNDDERYKHGSTLSKIDPTTNRVVGRPLVLGSPQSIAFGDGAVWVADHNGWLLKIDPTRFTVVARQRLDFGPHGVVVTGNTVYVADAHGDRLLDADPETAKIRRIAHLSVGPIYPAVGAGSIWSGSAAVREDPAKRDDRVVRIDPATLTIIETLHLGGNVTSVAFGYGSLWAALSTGQVVRISPAG
jgi:DNA-binding beta-propeller fold protein YncE